MMVLSRFRMSRDGLVSPIAWSNAMTWAVPLRVLSGGSLTAYAKRY
jgi:hypothetical protein